MKNKNKVAYIAIILLNLPMLTAVSYGQHLTKDFLKAESPVLVHDGATVTNQTGDYLYLLNAKQYNPLYRMWLYAQDSTAFIGQELEMFLLLTSSISEQDSLLDDLERNQVISQQLRERLAADRTGNYAELQEAILKLKIASGEMDTRSRELENILKNESRKQKRQRFWMRAGTYTVAIGTGAAAAFLLLK